MGKCVTAADGEDSGAVAVYLAGAHAGDGVEGGEVLRVGVRDGAHDGVGEDHEGRGFGGAGLLGAPDAEFLEEFFGLRVERGGNPGPGSGTRGTRCGGRV